MPYRNKKDQARAAARHYESNKEKIAKRSSARNKRQRILNRAFVNRVKSRFSCVDCGEGNPIILDFDHVRGVKRSNISDMASNYYSIKTIKEEIRKCEIRCANCHRKKTHERRTHQ